MKVDITPSYALGLIIQGATNQISVDSRVIAKEFEREHKSVLRTLDDLVEDGTNLCRETTKNAVRNIAVLNSTRPAF